MNSRSPRFAHWHLYALVAVGVVILVLAISELGAPSSSARVERETMTAEDGVVQTTVSGTGNVEPDTDQVVNFATSGTLESVYVQVGQHVNKGQLLATLSPTSDQLALDQADANLAADKDNLTSAEDGTSSSSGSSGSGSGSGTSASLKSTDSASTEFVDYKFVSQTTPTRPTTAPTTTTPTKTKPKHKKSGKKHKTSPTGSYGTGTTSTRPTTSTTSTAGTRTTSGTGSDTSTTSTPSPAQIASAEASVDSAQAAVDSAENTVAETKLYAPVGGTIASLESISPGQSVSSSGSSSSSSNSSSDSSDSSASSADTGSTGSDTAGSLGASSSSSSSSSGFAEIINSSTLTMTVAFSESDISSVHVGQPATVSIDALSGVELGAHVTAISPLGTTSSSVVSYDATVTLDQTNPEVRPGMSASASVITGQAQGLTVPNEAISGSGSSGTVQLEQNGKTVQQPVVVGLRGSSRSVIISGLKAADQLLVTVTLPALGTSTSSTSSTGTLGSGLAGRSGAAGGGFGGGGAGFGGGAFFRGDGAGGAGG